MVSPNTDEFLDLLASSQSRRLDDQRASVSNLPGLRLTPNNNQSVLGHLVTSDKEPDEDFFDILVKCQVHTCSCHAVPGSGGIRILGREGCLVRWRKDKEMGENPQKSPSALTFRSSIRSNQWLS